MSHRKDTDYLAISARVHAMENRLLNRERMERMIEARDAAEAAKLLAECGYEDGGALTPSAWRSCWPSPAAPPSGRSAPPCRTPGWWKFFR